MALVGIGVAAAACTPPGAGPSAADRALAAQVTGVWDAELLLDEASLGAPDDRPPGVRARAAGALTFLATQRAARAADPRLPRPPILTGVYDLRAEALGFSLPRSGPVAGLAAAVAAPDSVVAVLPAGSRGHALLLRGTVAGDVVRGTWAYAGRSIAGWHGTFLLHRRARAAPDGTRGSGTRAR